MSHSITLERQREGRFDYLTNGVRRNERPQNDGEIEMRRKNKLSRQTSTCQCLTIMIGMITILSFISLGLSGITIWKTYGDTMKYGSFCLNVTAYKYFEIPEHTLSKDVRNNNFMYCASSRSQVATLLTWIIEVKSKEQGQSALNRSSLFGNNAVYAHVIVGLSKYMRRDKIDKGEVILNTDHALSHIRGIKSSEHRLIVEKTGIYFIYSKVYFTLKSSPSEPLNHSIMRRNDNGEEKSIFLNENVSTYDRTSYLSGTVKLNKNDEVFTCVVNLTYISHEIGSNFMGLFLLD